MFICCVCGTSMIRMLINMSRIWLFELATSVSRANWSKFYLKCILSPVYLFVQHRKAHEKHRSSIYLVLKL